ncbi:MAG: DUF1934 domain-containing protein [Clostridiales bacterium]|nr:DUF1934 domain-containing protein [Clostridiales bacterium]
MTKDVIIRISGLQALGEGGRDDLEVITTGDYYQKSGKHYIIYDEAVEGETGSIRNTVKISPDRLDIRKSGLTSALLSFAQGHKSLTRYVMPMGEMLVGVNTRQVDVMEQEDHLHVSVDYSLDINYDHVSDCMITMDIRSKQSGALELN